MNTSAHVDVVIAAAPEDAPDAQGLPVAATDEPEHTDTARAPEWRVILIAETKAAGEEEASRLGITPIAIVTPRAPHAAAGLVADEIAVADGVTDEHRAELLPHVLPATATVAGAVTPAL